MMASPHTQATVVGQNEFPNRGPVVLAVASATMGLATLFVVGRMVSRIGIVRRVGCDDYIMIFAWVIALCLTLSINLGTTQGLGRHDRDIDANRRAGLRMCEYIFSILYNPALMATKSSVLVFYLRLAGNTQKILRMASWAVLGVVNIAGVILTFMNIFQCTPISAAWDITVKPIRCIPLLTEFICSAPVNVTTDLAILALPIPVLTGMRLPQRQKTILILTFTLGIFVTVVDVVRIYYLQQAIAFVPVGASSDPKAMFGQSYGFSWNASFSLMWSAVEVNVGITCACIPTLKPLIIRILPVMLIDPNWTRKSGSQYADENYAGFGTKPNSIENSQPPTRSNLTESPVSAPPPLFMITPPEERQSEEISIRDFLAGPDRWASTYSSRQSTILPSHRNSTNTARGVYFGFVNMKKPKSMLKTSAIESFKYCTIVSILFFLWGFSYGLLNTLNNVVAQVANMSTAQTLGLTSMYFGGGYFFGPIIVGEWLLRHDEHHRSRKRYSNEIESVGGFKATFIVGLLIYGTGTIMFWPGAVLAAYGGFMVSSFVVGFGLAVLETAANPFIILCGPPEYADTRLLLAQGVQAVGSVLSGLLANNVFFPTIEDREVDSTTLIDVQWTYLAVTLLSVLLALYFYYMPLPEVSDRELADLATRLPVNPKAKSNKNSRLSFSLRNITIILAVLSQWTYVAAQENMSVFFHSLITSFATSNAASSNPPGFTISVLNYLVIAHTAFAVSRFMVAGLTYLSVTHPSIRLLPTPRTVLLITVVLSTLCALVTMILPPTSDPNMLAIPIILFFFFEGPIFPLVFSLGLRGQGDRTKRAAAWLTMGGSGPAFWPFVTYAVVEKGGSVRTGNIVVVALMGVCAFYPLFLTISKRGRSMSDWILKASNGKSTGKRNWDKGGEGGILRRRLSNLVHHLHPPGVLHVHFHGGHKEKAERKRAGSGGATVEHYEKTRAGKREKEKKNNGLAPPRRSQDCDAERGGAVPDSSPQHQHHHIPPWERQGLELDTRILQD
ncbi:major facilitator superfamily domain-containing protein [Podospora fimiseda]|uniref:Major facilitator superfamily domain-containing protein n=1 Tax=Podospora fimiseda TaxID=252190 RepID=A0AAN7BU21_9PEZI|nr:major facilitator superfamily domain-containing protein [Podospora fimiseda]